MNDKPSTPVGDLTMDSTDAEAALAALRAIGSSQPVPHYGGGGGGSNL